MSNEKLEIKNYFQLDDRPYTEEEILKAINFQEQYFMGELYLWQSQ